MVTDLDALSMLSPAYIINELYHHHEHPAHAVIYYVVREFTQCALIT